MYSFDVLLVEILLGVIEALDKPVPERASNSLIAVELSEIETSSSERKLDVIDDGFLKAD
jgi:hypothetical protein